MFIPSDNYEMALKYYDTGRGVCGIACLAVIEKLSLREVLYNWKKLDMEFKGYSQVRDVCKYLKERGFIVKRKNRDTRILFTDNYFMARIQWIGNEGDQSKPFYGWAHWTRANCHTHYIIIYKNCFFCNSQGWDKRTNLRKYLASGPGVITSYLEISK